jgi:hypothetical protein
MSTNKKKTALATAALLIAMGMAGCTKHAEPAAATGPDSQLPFSQCMRDQGFSWFPDPNADGGLSVSVPDGTDQSAFAKAEEACKQFAPGGTRNGPIPDEDLTKMRKSAQCIRDHGFARYPDPDANGGITIDEKITGISHDDPAFQKAVQECAKHLPRPKTKATS